MPLQYNGRWKAQAQDNGTFSGENWFNRVVYAGSALLPEV
jgi:hypothetical protein